MPWARAAVATDKSGSSRSALANAVMRSVKSQGTAARSGVVSAYMAMGSALRTRAWTRLKKPGS
ncbi:hypothetical protein [Streptomyces sp. NPDC050534]|uniref:hypothetical protein n=1 Tax=Streptomyces sp. NPDC050534 TaxID=3365625 RepID=UPI0037BDBFB1